MTGFDLLHAVQPDDGWFAIVGIKGDSKRQELVATRQEFDEWVERFNRQERNVFFGVAKYASDENRKKDNIQGLKTFWLDID